MRKIKKRGDTQIEPIVVVTIAVTVAAIVGLGIYLHYNGKIQFLQNLLPDFKSEKPNVEHIEVVRYDISTGEVRYYDGSQWLEFPKGKEGGEKEVIVGNKKLKESDVKAEFTEHYYSFEKRGGRLTFELTFAENSQIYPLREGYSEKQKTGAGFIELPLVPMLKGVLYSIVKEPINDRTGVQKGFNPSWNLIDSIVQVYESFGEEAAIAIFSGNEYNRGEALLALTEANSDSNLIYGLFVLTPDNKLKFERIQVASLKLKSGPPEYDSFEGLESKEPYASIGKKMIEWRDSILKEPIEIEYYDINQKQNIPESFCVQKYDSYLVVDLSKPTDREECG